LDPDLPWLFEADAAGTPRWVRQGGGGIPGATALVAIPADWSLRRDDGSAATASGCILAPHRAIYPIRGKTTITTTGGRTWRIRTGEAQATETDFHWVGNRLWDGFIEPSLAFRGLPRLYDGARAIPDSALNWRPNPQAASYGPGAVAYLQHGEQVHGARMVLLPTGARIKLKPKDAAGGDLRLEGWQAAMASAAAPGIEATCVVEPDALVLRLAWRSADQVTGAAPSLPPEWVEVTVAWPQNPVATRLRLPFPARGVHAFDGADQALAPNAWLPIHRLTGARLVAVGCGLQLELLLRLRHTQQGGVPFQTRLPLRVAPGQSRVEIRLRDYAADIDRLLAADELLDAWVEASLCAGPQDLFKLRLSRYLCPLERKAPDVALTPKGLARIAPEALAGLPIRALRLEVPAEESVPLAPRLSEGVPTGAWAFVTPEREPGSWLIYPGAAASERFRPTLWTIPGENPAASPLTRALAVADREPRAAALDNVIAGMAEDYLEPCWTELERLAGHLGHLPLASFDLWRRLVHSPAAMAALALRLHPDLPPAFVARFALELPFTWELIPFQVWCVGAERLQRQCIAWFGDIHWRRELKRRLEEVQRALNTDHPALSKLLGVVQCVVLVEESPAVSLMRNTACDSLFREQLFDGSGSAVNALLTGHADDNWPAVDTRLQWINQHRQDGYLGMTLFCNDFPGFRDSVINLPILLAIQVTTDQTGSWFGHPAHIHALRQSRAFDPDWFDTAFDLTIARCLSTGVLKLDL
ncbi:MAG TPA: STY4851/ECs_5259 family protein, partial [Lamprocystis sp. (in: g-proteobacteria)]|nr:STY4851/ECs_5259 family protein [Lamprocystis sp. (in: g-proteobacteria)]